MQKHLCILISTPFFILYLILHKIGCMELDQKYTQPSILFIVRNSNRCLARRQVNKYTMHFPPTLVSECYLAFQVVSTQIIKNFHKVTYQNQMLCSSMLNFLGFFLTSVVSAYNPSFLLSRMSLLFTRGRAGMSFRPQPGLINTQKGQGTGGFQKSR